MKTLTRLVAIIAIASAALMPAFAQKGSFGRSSGSFGGGSSFGRSSGSFGGGSSFKSGGSGSFGRSGSFGSSKSYSSTGGSSGSFTTGGSYGSAQRSYSTTGGSGSFGKSGTFNSTPRTGGTSSFGTRPPSSSTNSSGTYPRSNTTTTYKYKSYNGPSVSTYQGHQVYINMNGGYSYYSGGPIIGYMPGYAPVAVTPVYGGGYYNPFAWVGWVIGIIVAALILWLIVRAIDNNRD